MPTTTDKSAQDKAQREQRAAERKAAAAQRKADKEKADREAAAKAAAEAEQSNTPDAPAEDTPADADGDTDGNDAESTEEPEPTIGTWGALPEPNTGGGSSRSQLTDPLNQVADGMTDHPGEWMTVKIASSARMGTVQASKARKLLHTNSIPGLAPGFLFDVQARGKYVMATAVEGTLTSGSRLVESAHPKPATK